jgi:hypothetical protein
LLIGMGMFTGPQEMRWTNAERFLIKQMEHSSLFP